MKQMRTWNHTIDPLPDLLRRHWGASEDKTFLLRYRKKVKGGFRNVELAVTERQARAWARRLQLSLPKHPEPAG